MAQNQQDLQNAISTQGLKITEAITAVQAAVKRLEDKLTASTPDLTAEVAAISAQVNSLQTLIDDVNTKGN